MCKAPKSRFPSKSCQNRKVFATVEGGWLVRFPNCHECQLGFQCPKKWEIGKQWPILEENFIAAATYWDKLTSYISHEAISATKKSPTVTVAQLEGQTCPPPNPHFGWRPFSTVGFVQKVKLYLRKQYFKFLPILISAGGHFQQLDLFKKWNCICGRRFSNFLPILISAGGHFHILDLFTKWNCICGNSFFNLLLGRSSFCQESNCVYITHVGPQQLMPSLCARFVTIEYDS